MTNRNVHAGIALVAALLIAGCSPKSDTTATNTAPGTIKLTDAQRKSIVDWAEAQADRLNRDLLEELTAEGRCFLSGTLLRGVFHLRLAILAARTHKAQVDEVLDRLRLAAAR